MSVLGYYVNCDDALCVACWDSEERCEACGGTLGMPRKPLSDLEPAIGVFARYYHNGVAEMDGHKFVVCSNEDHWQGFESWDEPAPLLSGEEQDTPTHCAKCHELMPHALTPDGYTYVEQAAQDHITEFALSLEPPHSHSVKVVHAWVEQYADRGEMNGILVALHNALYEAMCDDDYFSEEERR